MKKLFLLTILTLGLAAAAFARATPVINYVTLAPESLSSLEGGSKPTLKVTLSANVSANTDVTLSSNDPSLVVPSSITIPSGTRSASIQLSTLGVNSDTPTNVTATLGGSVVQSRSVTILRARVLRVSLMSENVALPVNTLQAGNPHTVTAKITLTGLAGPSGFTATFAGDSGSVLISFIIAGTNSFTVAAQAGIGRFTTGIFSSPVNSYSLTIQSGAGPVVVPYNVVP